MITFINLGKKGRLGNQLFQIAAVISLAKQNNDSYIFPPWQYEKYFNLHGCFSSNIKFLHTYNEPTFHYTPIPYNNRWKMHGANLEGYFQSQAFWKGFERTIKELLTPNVKTEDFSNYASIHVRRTDYLKFADCHPPCSMNYYEKAIEKTGYNKFIIFSDDINWCKNNFKGNNFDFSENNHEVVDLAVQIRCGANIIANSSFSWWAAWLNSAPNKVVIAPKKWFGPKLIKTHNTKDLIPSEWIQV